MQLYCRQCGAEIQAKDIDLEKMMAKCEKCNAVFSFADMYEDNHPKKQKQPDVYDVPMPDNMSIENLGDTLIIKRRWFIWLHLYLAVFAVVWNGMIWGVFVPRFSQGTFDTFGFGPLFLLPFIVAGIVIVYLALAGFLNTTTIRVDNDLTIHHHPLPFIDKHMSTSDIEQLFTKQRITHSDHGTNVTYELHVITTDGKQKRLLKGLNSSEQAMFIEQEVEKFLRIKDRPVRGEYR